MNQFDKWCPLARVVACDSGGLTFAGYSAGNLAHRSRTHPRENVPVALCRRDCALLRRVKRGACWRWECGA